MQFCVLGPVGMVGEGARCWLATDRQRTPASARTSLRSRVSRLRKTLALLEPGSSDPLVSELGGYRLALDAHDFDAQRFESGRGARGAGGCVVAARRDCCGGVLVGRGA